MAKNKKESGLDNKKKIFSLKTFIFIVLLFAVVFLYLILKITPFENLGFLKELIGTKMSLIEGVLIVLIIFISASLFISLTKKIIKKYLLNLGRSKENIKLFLIIYEYLLWALIVILTFLIFLKQGSSLITSIGLIGFGLTLALQKPILNFVGWLTIIFGKTYVIGDIISIDEKKGEVYDIRFMYTSLSELNQEGDSTGKSLFVPNEFVFSKIITNYTKGTPFVWDEIAFYLTYKSNWKKALNIIEKRVQEYYDKNIQKEIQKKFVGVFDGYEKIVTRLDAYNKGIIIKVRYLVHFNKANECKKEIIEILLDKLHSKDIYLGKTESVS